MQNSDSEFSGRRLILVCRCWVSPEQHIYIYIYTYKYIYVYVCIYIYIIELWIWKAEFYKYNYRYFCLASYNIESYSYDMCWLLNHMFKTFRAPPRGPSCRDLHFRNILNDNGCPIPISSVCSVCRVNCWNVGGWNDC